MQNANIKCAADAADLEERREIDHGAWNPLVHVSQSLPEASASWPICSHRTP